jgi:cytochrome c-type biogenesis protein
MATPEIQPTRVPNRILIFGGVMATVVVALIILLLNAGPEAAFATSGANMIVLAPAAFLAGLFSFLSPCTLPILPAYFAFTFQAQRERVVLTTVAFFLGLATTMVVLGASATALSQVLFRNLNLFTLVGGLVIIVFGVMSFLGKGFSGMQILDRPATSIAGSYFYGATFALGWTSCVGPILGALLTLLATQGIAVLQGAVLAFIYALGLGSPLIIVAAFFSRLGTGSRFWKFMRGRAFELNLGFTTLHLHSTSVASGLLLIVMGVMLATGQMSALTAWMQRTPFAQWAVGLEQWLENMFFGVRNGG